MRIAVINRNRRCVGGVETYLSAVLDGLAAKGCEIGHWFEVDGPPDREAVRAPPGSTSFSIERLGPEMAMAEMRRWRPEVIFGHGVKDREFERRTLTVAPAVLFVHNYYGTCISGRKSFLLPRGEPCGRRFGWPCLALYYPRRCGGWNPGVLWNQYRLQSARLRLMREYQFLLVASNHMREELLRNGISPERIVLCPHFARVRTDQADLRARSNSTGWNLIFLGRMDPWKGGKILLKALPIVEAALDKPIQMAFVGDGPARAQWAQLAERLVRSQPRLKIQFSGWQNAMDVEKRLGSAHLLVMPSIWPEPFGLSGLEAGQLGIPAVAFESGGVPDWLQNGVNGCLARANPPTARSLAEAIIKCLGDGSEYYRLRAGALDRSRHFQREDHLHILLDVLTRAASAWQTHPESSASRTVPRS